jgi:hypothetical protein
MVTILAIQQMWSSLLLDIDEPLSGNATVPLKIPSILTAQEFIKQNQ